MLRSFRENIKGRGGKIVLGLIILSFVGFGAADLVINRGGGAEVLKVNDISVDELAFAQEMQFARNNMIRQMGDSIRYQDLTEEKLAPVAKQQLIRRLLVEEKGSQLKVVVPEDLVEQSIINEPAFKVDGKFSSAHMNLVLADSGFNLGSFKDMLAEQVRERQFNIGLLASGFSTPKEVELLMRLSAEKRTVDWLQLNREDFEAGIDISEADLREHYEQHEDAFYTELAVDAEYILLEIDDFRPEIEQAAIEGEYQRQLASFEPAETRQVSHILLEINDDQPEEAAIEKAKALRARVEGGENFAELAREFSQDSGSAAEGGDLGETERDGSYPENFENAVFSLELGAVSEPVVTDAGVHLIRVGSINQSVMPPLVAVRADIEDQLQLVEAKRRFVELSESLVDMVFNADGLAESARQLDLRLNTAGPITRSGNLLSSDGDEIGELNPALRDARVLEALYSNDLLEGGLNSNLIELDADRRIVVRVAQVHPPRLLSFAEASAIIKQRVLAEKVTASLDELAGDIISAVNSGEDFGAVAERYSLNLGKDMQLARTNREIEPALLEAVYSVPISELGDGSASSVRRLADGQGNLYLFQLTAVDDSLDTEAAEMERLLGQQLEGMVSREEAGAFWQSVRLAAEIVEY